MEIYRIIVEDKKGNLFELDSPWMNENFNYDKDNDSLRAITHPRKILNIRRLDKKV